MIEKNKIKELMEEMAVNETGIQEWVRKTKTIDSIEKMPGDASTRRYYRVWAGSKTYILMRMESFEKEGMNLPFIVMQSHLKSSGVDVPEILAIEPALGSMLLEDLGDTMLLRELQEVSDTNVERKLYERVIDHLLDLQVNASPKKGGVHLPAFDLRFDEEKLMWEVNFTVEHFYDMHLKRIMKPEHRKIIYSSFQEICKRLADEPTVFTHRDFHSRNVMVTDGKESRRFVMIDFQDARMGPAQYDLVSLLRDSYYQLEEVQIERLTSYYIDEFEKRVGRKSDRVHFREMFDLMAIQRNFKAIGSFASFSNRRSNPTYLKYVGNTFENIRRTLLKYPHYRELREILFHYYYF